MDHYEVLGVAPDASKAAIRRAYLVQARRFHPDFHGNDPAARERAEHRMRLVNRAWEVLSDSGSRAVYDARGRSRAPTRPASPGRAAEASTAWRPYDSSEPEPFDDRQDRPLTAGGLPGWLRMAPPLLFVVGLFSTFVGAFMGLAPIVVFGALSSGASAVLFLVAPLVALASSRGRR